MSQIKLQKQHWLPDLNLDYFRVQIRVIAIIKRLSIGNAVPIFSLETFLKLK
jgi:hypothetical protein